MPPKVARAVPLKAFAEARRAARAQFAAARAFAAAAAGAKSDEIGARATLSRFIRIHLEFLAGHTDLAAVLYDGDARASGDRALREHRKLMMFLMTEFEKIVAAGKTVRSVRAGVDPAMAAAHCLGAIQMAWTFWTMGGRRGDLIQAGLNLFEQLWEGIRI